LKRRAARAAEIATLARKVSRFDSHRVTASWSIVDHGHGVGPDLPTTLPTVRLDIVDDPDSQLDRPLYAGNLTYVAVESFFCSLA
jgi:hypothetical protein